MSTRTKALRDAFRPRPMAERELELARANPRGVLEALRPLISAERQRRIDTVIGNRSGRLHVALEGVHDPHNAAAVVRTADAYGVQRVHIVEHGTRFRASRKVTQGSHKWVDISVWKTPEPFVAAMHEAGVRVLIAVMDAAVDIRELDPAQSMALVFGNEADGVSAAIRGLADGAFRIPMYGFVESFNVSVAAAIAVSTLRANGGGDLSPEAADELRARFYLRTVRAGYDVACRAMGVGERGAP